jgi:hypothetical protein
MLQGIQGIKDHSFITTIESHHLRTCLERGFGQCSSYLMLIFKYVGSQYCGSPSDSSGISSEKVAVLY